MISRKSFFVLVSFFVLSFNISAKSTALLQIDNRVKFQKVDGFGGFGFSPSWGVSMSSAEIDKLWGKGAQQMGYNIMRAIVYSNPSSWSALLPTLKRAKDNGAIIFASPWSGPAEYKTSKSTVSGHVLESKYGDFAKFLKNYVVFMKNNGINLEAISIQNEPDFDPKYDGTLWTAAEFIKFLRQYADSIPCKIMAPESLAFRRELSDSILNDSVAASKLYILGGHLYGDQANLNYPLAIKKGKKIWMTEFLINDNQTINWSDVFPFVKAINSSMMANMNAWIHYASKRYYAMLGDGTFGTIDGEITKRGYAMSHYAKYVTGKTRIKHNLNDPEHGLFSTAYQSVNGDSIVVMLINESNSSYDLTLDLPFKVTDYRTVLTTVSKNMVNTIGNVSETSQPVITVAASSVSTIIFPKTSERDTPQTYPTDSLIFSDKFTDYGGYSVFPDGWQAQLDGGIRNPGTYYSGSRLFFFRPESVIPAGIYIRSSSSNPGSATYGQFSNKQLYLNKGKYSLTYSAVGWKAKPALTMSIINKSTAKSIATKNLQLTSKIDGISGWSVDLNDVNTDTLNFEVTTSGNYLLKWSVPFNSANSSGGMSETVFGNIQLTPQIITDLQGNLNNFISKTIKSVQYYNLQGIELKKPERGIVIVRTVYDNGTFSTRKELFE
jgi:O-glycosyl hydrolase